MQKTNIRKKRYKELIETLWNVNPTHNEIFLNWVVGINRNIVECK